jgi:hypothetical protein
VKAFDRDVLVAGAAVALLAGVATAEVGLTPLRRTLPAEAPSLDTTVANADPSPGQADLARAPDAAPPAVLAPVGARRVIPRAKERLEEAATDQSPASEEDAAQADSVAGQVDVARAPAQHLGRPAGDRGADGDPEPPVPTLDPPVEPATTTPE